jgi:hypothetical protein
VSGGGPQYDAVAQKDFECTAAEHVGQTDVECTLQGSNLQPTVPKTVALSS